MQSENLIEFESKPKMIDAAVHAAHIKRLEKPAGSVDVVLDTDTFNEINDQFALAYLIKKSEKLKLKAIYAAPFYNKNSSGAGDGMEKSYDEILRGLSFMKPRRSQGHYPPRFLKLHEIRDRAGCLRFRQATLLSSHRATPPKSLSTSSPSAQSPT